MGGEPRWDKMGKRKGPLPTKQRCSNYQYDYDKHGKKCGPAKTGSYDYVTAL